jgi:hypothetical protein
MPDKTLLPDRQLRERIIDIVQRVREQVPQDVTNFNIEKHFGLQVCRGKLPVDKDGAYIEKEAIIIINDQITSDERYNFTVFHELSHHLIRKDEDLYSYIHDAYLAPNDFENMIELICNVGAAEFLLPRDTVRGLIESEGVSLNLVPRLCQSDTVSGPVALIQLIQCAPNQCYGVVCEYGVSPISAGAIQETFFNSHPENTLYILYAMWSPSAKYKIARFTSIPKNHLLMQAFTDNAMVKGYDRIPFRSGTDWQVQAETLRFRGKVYGIFNATPPPDLRQLSFL